jgi:hypothetical protein
MRNWLRLLPSALRRRPLALVGTSLLGLALVFVAGATLAGGHLSARAARLDATPNIGQNGTTLTETVTATGHLVKVFHWTIQKTVTPSQWDLFRGDSGTSQYTVSVTKDDGTLSASFDGQVCVTNGGSADTVGLAITAEVNLPPTQEDTATTDDDAGVIASAPVDISSAPVIPAGQMRCYNFTVDLTSNIVPGGNYKVLADTTIQNHSGSLGTPKGPEEAADATLPSTPTLINDTIHVVDTNGGSWTFSASGSVGYTETFTCDGDQGDHPNTATIQETGQSASAGVHVNCWALNVSKTANTAFTRTYNWNISKVCDQTSLTLQVGQSFVVNCSVAVGATHTDSDWMVSGLIRVHNPAPIPATLNGVSDAMTGIGAVTVQCPVSFPYNLPANNDLVCNYSVAVPDASARTNTGTATLQNFSYDPHLTPTPAGTTDFSGSVGVDFGSADITYLDTQVSVSDIFHGSLGVCTYVGPDGLQCKYTYSFTVGPYAVCGDYTLNNVARFVTNDSGTSGSSRWTVSVHVPCATGCTLTIGYWKTHAGFTGNNADRVTQFLPIWLGTAGGAKSVQVTTASQAVSLLSMSGNASNGINKLYAQLLGAKLNIAAGASVSPVGSTIASADAFLATHNSADWGSLTKSQQSYVLGLAAALDNYNSGLTGPGHCTE